MTIPQLTQRPTHRAVPLLRSEVSRLTHRRLFRILALVLLGGITLISVLVFFAHSDTATPVSRERADRLQERALEGWDQCVQGVPQDQVEEFCGPSPAEDPVDAYDLGPDDRYRAGENLPVVVLGVSLAAAGVAFIVGASAGGAEWSSRSMTLQLLFEPRRLRLLTIKWLSLLITMAGLTSVALAVGLAIGAVTASLRGTWDSTYRLTSEQGSALMQTLMSMAGRGLVLTVLAATVGYALAMLVRNTGASLGVAFVYFVVIENAVRFALLRYGTEPYMLSTNAGAFLFPGGLDVPGKEVIVDGYPQLTSVHVSNLRALLTLTGYSVLLSLPAAWSFTRRDVS